MAHNEPDLGHAVGWVGRGRARQGPMLAGWLEGLVWLARRGCLMGGYAEGV